MIAADGHNYERKNIERWLQNHDTSPKTNIVLPHKHLAPNHELRARCVSWNESHCTEAGLKKQLKQMSGEILLADNPPAALVAVRKISALVELAQTKECMLLGPAGVARLEKIARAAEVVDEQVASAFAVLKSHCSVFVRRCHDKYRDLQNMQLASAAAVDAIVVSDAATKQELSKAEKQVAAAAKKEAAAMKKMEAATRIWEKTKTALSSALEKQDNAREKLKNLKERVRSYEQLGVEFAKQSSALCKKLEEIGEVLGEKEGDAGSDGRCSSSLLSSSSVPDSSGGGGACIDSNTGNNSTNISVGSKRKGKSSPSAMAPIRKRAKKGRNGSASGGSSIRAGSVHVAKRLFEEGLALFDGDGFKCKDENRGQLYIEAASAAGFPTAEAYSYYKGWSGFAVDYEKAFSLFKKIAEETEYSYAENFVGRCFFCGNGVEQNLTKAAEWFTKAANAGYGPGDHASLWRKSMLSDVWQVWTDWASCTRWGLVWSATLTGRMSCTSLPLKMATSRFSVLRLA